jgi:tRNA(fMet)-specific endonuclease VapC
MAHVATGRSRKARDEFYRLTNEPNAQLSISALTEAEVRFGMAKRALSPVRIAAIENLMSYFDVLPWGSEEAAVYGKARRDLEQRGIRYQHMDLLIGTQAVATNATLVTNDSIFERLAPVIGIPALVDWATDL